MAFVETQDVVRHPIDRYSRMHSLPTTFSVVKLAFGLMFTFLPHVIFGRFQQKKKRKKNDPKLPKSKFQNSSRSGRLKYVRVRDFDQ